MNCSEKLFLERYRLDCKRQPNREASLKELISTWKLLFPKLTDPYGMSPSEKGKLAKASVHFGGGDPGPHLVLSAPYLYALTSVRKVHHLATWRSHDTDEVIHDKLIDEAGTPPDWIPLGPHVIGPFKSFRGFTWWTTMDVISTGQPFVAGRRLGLLDSWIADLAVILRWRFDPSASAVRLPTCCDAFDGPVFESMPDSAPSGRTIDLNADPFAEGEPEFAVKELPVDQIAVFPIRVGSDLRRDVLPPVSEDDATWNRLIDYYQYASK